MNLRLDQIDELSIHALEKMAPLTQKESRIPNSSLKSHENDRQDIIKPVSLHHAMNQAYHLELGLNNPAYRQTATFARG